MLYMLYYLKSSIPYALTLNLHCKIHESNLNNQLRTRSERQPILVK